MTPSRYIQPNRTPTAQIISHDPLDTQIIRLDAFGFAQLCRALPLEPEATFDQDIAAIRDLGSLVEILCGHGMRSRMKGSRNLNCDIVDLYPPEDA